MEGCRDVVRWDQNSALLFPSVGAFVTVVVFRDDGAPKVYSETELIRTAVVRSANLGDAKVLPELLRGGEDASVAKATAGTGEQSP